MAGMFPNLSISDIKNVWDDSNGLDAVISVLVGWSSTPVIGSSKSIHNHHKTRYLKAVVSPPSLMSEHAAEWSQVENRKHQRQDKPGFCKKVGMEELIEKRNKSYRKAEETRMREVAGFYAAEARELSRRVQDLQMERFIQKNRDLSGNQIDLHNLQTSEALRQLQIFLAAKKAILGQKGGSATVVTGRGTGSGSGRAKIRPSVLTWLRQKGYKYHFVNDGCLKVSFKLSN